MSSYPVIRIAHRGASGIAPENTLPAFEKALEIGVDAVEMDVYATRDGQVIVMHDGDVQRTTDGSGRISEMDFEQIRRLDAGRWFSDAFREVQVPSLAEVLDRVRTHAIGVVEIKQPGIVPGVLQAIRDTHTEDEVVVISFSKDVLTDMHHSGAVIPTGLLIGHTDAPSEHDKATQLVQDTRRVGACLLNIAHSAITPEFAYEVRRRGVALWTWTADAPERMRELVEVGVNGITTNYPERLNRVLSGL